MWTPPQLRTALLLTLLFVLLPAPAAGQGWVEPDRPTPDVVPVAAFPAVERLRTNVQVRVADGIAHVEVEEWFRNTGRGIAEGVYLYPLPGGAVFRSYSLFQDDLELTGETMEAETARAIYEAIVRQRKDPALIELVGHGLVRARVFPFGPGETRRITLRYTQVLRSAGQALELRYAAGGPGLRPPPGVGRAPASGRSGRPAGLDAAPVDFTVTVEDAERFLAPYSPTHALRSEREEGRLVVRPEAPLSGGFTLFLPRAGEAVRFVVAAHRPSSEDGYFMLTLSPGDAAASAMPRDLTVVVDVSGSMSGEKIEQTRRAVVQLLGSLGAEDRFRLIRFSSGVETHRPGWTPAHPDQLAEARGWAEALPAQGGTNIEGALEEAFRAETPSDRLPVVVFLTDGVPTVGERDPERIAARADELRDRARVFAFGVGYDVNTYLLDRLAAAGRGSVEYVGPGEDVEHSLGVLAAAIRHPVLADLELREMPGRIREVYPSRLPDLFQGQELTLFGRYEGPAAGEITLEGVREGRTVRFSTEAVFPEHALEHDFIPRLWAARRIGELAREIRLHGPDPELVEAVRETALRYGILTEYTAHLVLEPSAVADLPPGVYIQFRSPRVERREAAASFGRSAVLGARAAEQARDARTTADIAAAEELAVASARGQAPGAEGGELAVAGGRAFLLRDGVWIDRLHVDEAPTVRVEAFSPAWFALLEALPELRSWWGSLSPVIVAGREVSLASGEEGESVLDPEEVQRIVRAFRAL